MALALESLPKFPNIATGRVIFGVVDVVGIWTSTLSDSDGKVCQLGRRGPYLCTPQLYPIVADAGFFYLLRRCVFLGSFKVGPRAGQLFLFPTDFIAAQERPKMSDAWYSGTKDETVVGSPIIGVVRK
jgi:hypothetical protein